MEGLIEMSWSDALNGTVGSLIGQAERDALPGLIAGVLGTEGLRNILARLKDAGLQGEIASWLDKNKDNLPITPDQIRTALGDEHVQQLARALGIPVDTVLATLAEYLPQAANAAGPAAAPPG